MSYFDSTGRPLSFQGSPLGSGGEGTVWRTDRKREVAKIYHIPSKRQIRKLEIMIENPPKDYLLKTLNHVSIAWPTNLVKDSKGTYVGFLMPSIDRSVELTKVYNPKLRKKYYLNLAGSIYMLLQRISRGSSKIFTPKVIF